MAYLLLPLLLAIAYPILSWILSFRRPGPSPTPHPITTTLSSKLAFFTSAASILQDVPGSYSFHARTLRGRTQIYLRDPALIAELARISDTVASFTEWTRATLHRDYTMGGHDSYTAEQPQGRQAMFRFIKTTLTTGLRNVVWGDVVAAAETVPASRWAERQVLPQVMRVFAGERLAADPEFVAGCAGYTKAVTTGGVLGLVPGKWAKRFGGWWIMRGKRDYVEKRIREVIREGAVEEGTLLKVMVASMRSKDGGVVDVKRVVNQFLVGVFAAVHTSSSSMTSTLLELAGHPECQPELRADIEESIAAHSGWTLDALDSMHKLDSFMKESQRMRPLTQISVFRVAQKPYTFSDGTTAQPGDHLAALIKNTDPSVYPNPEVFDPWRYSRLREEGARGQEMTSIDSPNWLIFGSGKHACPGRLFATALSKVILGKMLLGWSLEMEGGMGRPVNKAFEESFVPLSAEETRIRFLKLSRDEV